MDLCNQSCWLAILCGKNFNPGHYVQIVQPNFPIPAMFIGTTDCHFIPFSLTLTLAVGHTVSPKQNLLASFCSTLSDWMGWNLVWSWKEFKLNIPETISEWDLFSAYGDEAIQAEHLETTFDWDLFNRGKQLLFYWLHQKNLTLACIQTFINQVNSALA